MVDKTPERHTNRQRFSFEGKLLTLFALMILLNAGITSLVYIAVSDRITASIIAVLLCLVIGLILLKQMLHPVNKILQALIDGMQSFKDGDFSVIVIVSTASCMSVCLCI